MDGDTEFPTICGVDPTILMLMVTMSLQYRMLDYRKSFVLMVFISPNKGLACTVGTLWIPFDLIKSRPLRDNSSSQLAKWWTLSTLAG